jgi:TolB-like protein/DNA-binding winged helix-turn-helix (wHTH) protein/Flp pilus assembly protein TadD
MPDLTQASAIRRFGAFEINLQSGELRKKGMRLRLSGQPFQVLAVLIERPGEVITREELHSKLWLADTFVDFDHGLNNAVARIREVLEDSAETPRYVETIPRRGYRFIAPLAEVPQATGAAPAPGPQLAPPIVVPSEATVLTREKRFTSRRRRMWALLGAAAVLALVVVGVLVRGRRSGTKPPPIKSLAVLPLKNLSGDPTQEYVADGMTEAVISRLSMIRGLRVISRTTMMRFKESGMSVPEIAKNLNVDGIVEGSVRRQAGHVRVTVQLIRGATDDHFWSETYDRELDDMLSLKSDVAHAIAERVQVTLTGEERVRLVAARPVAPGVYQSFLRGQSELAKSNTRAGIEKSIAYFQQAIRQDGSFAPAYVGLAEAYSEIGMVFMGAPPADVRSQATRAARKALELDPMIPDAHTLLADQYQELWRWADAEAEYRRALELNPNDAGAHHALARWLLCQGRTDEAQSWAWRARELDPVGIDGTSLAWILFQSHRFDEAIREQRSELALHPDSAIGYWFLGFALSGKGRNEEAIPVLKKAFTLSGGSPAVMGVLVRAYARAGHRKEALRLLEELKQRQKKGYVPAAAFVNAYLGLDDREQVFAWCERAYQEKSSILQWIKVHPFFDSVREDPRFKDLLHRVSLDA